jgi:predicted ester cyclase
MVAERQVVYLPGPSGRALYSERIDEMSLEATREVVTAYLQNHGEQSLLAENAVFTDMSTGEEYRGRDAIAQSLEYFYHQAFEARPEVQSTLIDDGHAVAEGEFVGRHIGDFGGISATGREVRVPICVAYDVEGDKITRARIYLLGNVLMEQLGAIPESAHAG